MDSYTTLRYNQGWKIAPKQSPCMPEGFHITLETQNREPGTRLKQSKNNNKDLIYGYKIQRQTSNDLKKEIKANWLQSDTILFSHVQTKTIL